jgi:arsenate reductase
MTQWVNIAFMTITEGKTLLHNPRCSKSRLALQMLEESGVEFTVREYLADPLSRDELSELQALLGMAPLEWTRTGEAEWAETGLSSSASQDELLDALASWPKLLQRPILISGGVARVGRPPEALRELLEA